MGHLERLLLQAKDRGTPLDDDSDLEAPAAARSLPGSLALSLDFRGFRRLQLSSPFLAKNRVITAPAASAAGSAFNLLRTRVRRVMQAQKLSTLAVSSASGSDGKTLVAVNLALRLAAEDAAEVILVDFDLRKPAVWKLLGIDPALPGLVAYLNGDASLQDLCVCPVGRERLAILPNAQAFENSSEILSSARVAELVAQLKRGAPGRVVIFDMPPLLYTDDLLAFGAHVDGLLLVAREGRTKRADFAETLDLLGGINVIGTVLNNSAGRSDAYY